MALEARPIPPSVVLVVKLVSATRVQPITGIVIDESGLVLVPAAFVDSESEYIVLDGGTDIVRHGRPGKVVQASVSGTLAVLSVKGLSRPGIALSEYTPEMKADLFLTAFPPAEYLAKGAPPLWRPVELVKGDSEKPTLISPGTPLPYVTGPIFDSCGHLAGINITSGEQSLATDIAPSTIFTSELRGMLETLQINLPLTNCEAYTRIAASQPEVRPVDAAPATTQSNDPKLIGPEVYRPVLTRKRLNPFQGAALPPAHMEIPEPPSIWFSIPLWLPLLALIVLAALVWKAVFYFRLKRQAVHATALNSVQAAAEEPDTTPLFGNGAGDSIKPRSVPIQAAVMPDMDQLPGTCDAVLVVDILIDANTRLKRYCAVDSSDIDVLLGRGDADISIEHPVVSREHARLRIDSDAMTISDLGSSSGTYVREIPCLPGEILYIEPGDDVFLGDVQLRFEVLRKELTAP